MACRPVFWLWLPIAAPEPGPGLPARWGHSSPAGSKALATLACASAFCWSGLLAALTCCPSVFLRAGVAFRVETLDSAFFLTRSSASSASLRVYVLETCSSRSLPPLARHMCCCADGDCGHWTAVNASFTEHQATERQAHVCHWTAGPLECCTSAKLPRYSGYSSAVLPPLWRI